MFEDFYIKYDEDNIADFLLNKSLKSKEIRKDFYQTFFGITDKNNVSNFTLEEHDKIINSFRLFCLSKLNGKKRYIGNKYTKKNIIDYYCKFWYNLFNHIPIINDLSELQNEINFILDEGRFITEVNNMFGIRYSSFVLKPNTFNFIYLNIENIRTKIEESMEIQHDLRPHQYTINLRTFIEEPSGIIDKIVFHNLNQTERNNKTLNIIWNKDKLDKLENALRNGEKYYIKDKSYLRKFSLKEAFNNFNEENRKNETVPKGRYVIFNEMFESFDCSANHCCEGYKNNIEDAPLYHTRTNTKDNNQIFDRIYLEFSNNLEILNHIYYPIEFDVSFDIYKNIVQQNGSAKFKISGPRVNHTLEKQFLPDFIAGKIHFSCLVDFGEPDNYSLLYDFFSYKLKKDLQNTESRSDIMTETSYNEYKKSFLSDV